MLKQLKFQLMDLRNKWQKKQLVKNHRFNFEKAKSIGVLLDDTYDDDMKAALNTFTNEMKLLNKKVDVLKFYVQFPGHESHEEINAFSESDCGLFGKWKSHFVENFCKKEFDYLINTTSLENPYLTNVLLCSSAKCKVGFGDNSKILLENHHILLTNHNGSLTHCLKMFSNYIDKIS
ncbi:MAG TPA: hypothetical protein ACFCUD_07120 [Cyclobacteriaceae bacterium]